MKKLILLSILGLGFARPIAAVGVGHFFRVNEIAERVRQQSQAKKHWYSAFCKKPKPTTVNGIGLVLAFEKQGLEIVNISACASVRYTIDYLLDAFDQQVCIAMCNYKRKHNYSDWHSFSEADFKELDAINKKYLDTLTEVLSQKYGKSAEPYLTEIQKARTKFEQNNNGYLLERT